MERVQLGVGCDSPGKGKAFAGDIEGTGEGIVADRIEEDIEGNSHRREVQRN